MDEKRCGGHTCLWHTVKHVFFLRKFGDQKEKKIIIAQTMLI